MKILFLVLMCLRQPGVPSEATVSVRYIANDGFLVEINKTKIMFDGLFGGFEADWCDVPSPETKSKLEKAAPPFDAIDYVFISHDHPDHFNAGMVVEHARREPRCAIICPRQVRAKLAANPDFPEIEKNVMAYTPAINTDTVLVSGRVRVTVYRLEHSLYPEKDSLTGLEINRHRNVENLGFLVEVGGVRLFHSGDINPWNETQLETYHLPAEHIDIAFLDRLFLTRQDGSGISIIADHIRPQKTIFMHIEPKNRNLYRMIVEQVRERLPNVFLFDSSMERRTMTVHPPTRRVEEKGMKNDE